MKKIIAMIAMLISFGMARADVLWWQVNSSATVDGTAIQQFLVPYVEDDDNWNAVRVKVIDGET